MILIVQSLWNEAITDKLVEGAQHVLEEKNHAFETVQVPGALEIPLVTKWAWAKGQRVQKPLLGVIACGTVVKGETHHFETVAAESARALTALSMDLRLPIGNAILCVYNIDQALDRAGGKEGNKGEEAAHAVLHMIEIQQTKEY